MANDMIEMKRQFSSHLKKCLENRYGGRMPSFSTIARDLSLNATHLPHVSAETVRKWIRGDTIPHYPRMQSLADWLGSELIEPFEHWHASNITNGQSHESRVTPEEAMRFVVLAQNLGREEFNLVMRLAEKLQSKSTNGKNILR